MNEGLVHRALVMQNANARTNIAHTITRGERRGSTRKIYRQKGTGRARMGANRSPIRRKG
jgi:large subunit ribosomal protein L4